MPRFIAKPLRLILLCLIGLNAFSVKADSVIDDQKNNAPANTQKQQAVDTAVDNLKEPLYSPFIERYVLDEIKQLRIDQAQTKNELIQQIVDREHHSVDRAVTYATDTVTYFFYLIAGATSVLVLVGWTSIREIKERVHSLADEEISRLVHQYEERLENIEKEVQKKTKHIKENKEEIELTQEVQSLWLRAQQETSPAAKIAVYDRLLTLRSDDCEALTYKADTVLELAEPQWAANLCHQALAIDPNNSHAFYQLGCAYVALDNFDESVSFLQKAISHNEAYRTEMSTDTALEKLRGYEPFEKMIASTH
ncbi:MAG TPA: tetratricopeptide repeat protein [Marinagarivorans sp.]